MLFGAEKTMNIERAKGTGHGGTIFRKLPTLKRVCFTFLLLAPYLSQDRFNRPAGTGLVPHDSRHFAPGYYRAVPPGQKPFAHRKCLALS